MDHPQAHTRELTGANGGGRRTRAIVWRACWHARAPSRTPRWPLRRARCRALRLVLFGARRWLQHRRLWHWRPRFLPRQGARRTSRGLTVQPATMSWSCICPPTARPARPPPPPPPRQWEDPQGRQRLWESAERTTRRGDVDGVAILAKVWPAAVMQGLAPPGGGSGRRVAGGAPGLAVAAFWAVGASVLRLVTRAFPAQLPLSSLPPSLPSPFPPCTVDPAPRQACTAAGTEAVPSAHCQLLPGGKLACFFGLKVFGLG